jgi:hypothetical protein
MLMPTMPGVSLARGDIVADGEGLTGIVSSAEQSAMGWRAIVREAVA